MLSVGRASTLLGCGCLLGCSLVDLDSYTAGDGADAGVGGAGGDGTGGSAGSMGGTGNSGGLCAHECIPRPETGWRGPAYFFRSGGAVQQAPACAGQGWEGGFDDINAQEATCPACDCEAPLGGTCTLAESGLAFQFKSCNGAYASMTGLQPGSCHVVPNIPPNYIGLGLQLTLEPTGASCTAIEPPPVINTPSFSDRAAVCDVMVENECPGNDVCAPKPVTPYQPSWCVYREGEHPACPADYRNREVMYRSMRDTRGCDSCTCGSPEGRICTATIAMFTDGSCTADRIDVAYSLCVERPQGHNWLRVEQIGVDGGQCQAGTRLPIGEVEPTEPVTICCRDT